MVMKKEVLKQAGAFVREALEALPAPSLSWSGHSGTVGATRMRGFVFWKAGLTEDVEQAYERFVILQSRNSGCNKDERFCMFGKQDYQRMLNRPMRGL